MECLKELERHSANCALLHVLVAKAPKVLKPPILKEIKTVRINTDFVVRLAALVACFWLVVFGGEREAIALNQRSVPNVIIEREDRRKACFTTIQRSFLP
jgi:hypothetical protein